MSSSSKELRSIIEAYERAQEANEGCALATVSSISGSAYRRPGARMLVLSDGSIFGSVSGGCLERDVIEQSLRLISQNKEDKLLLEYDTSHDDDMVLGSTTGCPGTIQITVELISADKRPDSISKMIDELSKAPSLIIFGAGHDTPVLVDLAVELGFSVTVCDHRRGFADPNRFNPKSKVMHIRPEDEASYPSIFPNSFCIIMSHNFIVDKQVLSHLIPSRCPYIGAMGPKKRTQRIIEELANSGQNFSAGKLEKLHAPIGLDIGAESAEQIAIAIIAEIQAVSSGRNAGFLRDRNEPIHNIASAQSPEQEPIRKELDSCPISQ